MEYLRTGRTVMLSPEDEKLVTLARSSRVRNHSERGAAVRDLDGRTYVASSVTLPSLEIAALDLAVAMAISSGATGLEAGAVVSTVDGAIVDLSTVRELAGNDVPVYVADHEGTIVSVRAS
ncbi:cytidine deaminase [Aeromicrobium sp.]|uniref:cytidine deaminase n=1 Tax=Aeromicrobium sp. TaxID=1871063 RepID=UPI003D6ADC9C